jgi:hypothetical protein
MKLWKLTSGKTGYDTFDAAIVAAEDIEAAKGTHPSGVWPTNFRSGSAEAWAFKPSEVSAVLIGTATEGTPAGVILASFNAG